MKKIIPLVSIAILVLVTISSLLFVIDNILLRGKYFNAFIYKSDCSFLVPDGYKIVYSIKENKYAVQVVGFGDEYLYNGKGGITPMYSFIAKPCVFDDICSAKGYLKAYIEQNKPTMSSYK